MSMAKLSQRKEEAKRSHRGSTIFVRVLSCILLISSIAVQAQAAAQDVPAEQTVVYRLSCKLYERASQTWPFASTNEKAFQLELTENLQASFQIASLELRDNSNKVIASLIGKLSVSYKEKNLIWDEESLTYRLNMSIVDSISGKSSERNGLEIASDRGDLFVLKSPIEDRDVVLDCSSGKGFK